MQCPKCNSLLMGATKRGIDVDLCSNCKGMWLDLNELDELEDHEFSDDENKGTLIFRDVESKLNCPHCSSLLKSFHYRFYDLILDYCPNQHGFWLDEGEDAKVLEFMEKDAHDLERKIGAEERWGKIIKKLRSRSLIDRIL